MGYNNTKSRCIIALKDCHMIRSAQQVQHSVREFASQWATTQCIHLSFSTIASMILVSQSVWKHQRRSPLSNSSNSSHQSLGTGATQNGCEVIMQKPDCLYFCHSSCPVDVIILYIFVYSYIDVHQCICVGEWLWKYKGRSLLSNSSDSSHQSPSTGSTRQPLGLAFSESLWQDRVYCILLCLYIYISLYWLDASRCYFWVYMLLCS